MNVSQVNIQMMFSLEWSTATGRIWAWISPNVNRFLIFIDSVNVEEMTCQDLLAA